MYGVKVVQMYHKVLQLHVRVHLRKIVYSRLKGNPEYVNTPWHDFWVWSEEQLAWNIQLESILKCLILKLHSWCIQVVYSKF